jgi:hypothetical protein
MGTSLLLAEQAMSPLAHLQRFANAFSGMRKNSDGFCSEFLRIPLQAKVNGSK